MIKVPAYPRHDVVGPCVCGSWPGGQCLKCRLVVPSVNELFGPLVPVSQTAAPSGQAPLEGVKALEWDEVTSTRSDEDPTREHTGDYETVTPFGTYYIEQYFGSDSYGWEVTMNGYEKIADKDDPEAAKAAAQADYEARIRSALVPASAEPVVEGEYELAETIHGEIVRIVKRRNPLKEPIISPPASGAVEAGWQLVPVAALKWLNGEGPDHNGDWFGDVSGRGNFWWRKHFSDMLAAAPTERAGRWRS